MEEALQLVNRLGDLLGIKNQGSHFEWSEEVKNQVLAKLPVSLFDELSWLGELIDFLDEVRMQPVYEQWFEDECRANDCQHD